MSQARAPLHLTVLDKATSARETPGIKHHEPIFQAHAPRHVDLASRSNGHTLLPCHARSYHAMQPHICISRCPTLPEYLLLLYVRCIARTAPS